MAKMHHSLVSLRVLPALLFLSSLGQAHPVRRQTGQVYTGSASYHTWGGALTACGQPGDDSQAITALNPEQFGDLNNNSPVCGKTITISHGGIEVQATIVDQGGVGFGGLDLAQNVFEQLMPLATGRFDVDWWFNDHDPGTAGSGSASGTASTTAQATSQAETTGTAGNTAIPTAQSTAVPDSTTQAGDGGAPSGNTQTGAATSAAGVGITGQGVSSGADASAEVGGGTTATTAAQSAPAQSAGGCRGRGCCGSGRWGGGGRGGR